MTSDRISVIVEEMVRIGLVDKRGRLDKFTTFHMVWVLHPELSQDEIQEIFDYLGPARESETSADKLFLLLLLFFLLLFICLFILFL